MNRFLSLFLFLSTALSLSAQHVRSVVGFPAAEPGYSLGVSACYAGQIGDYLVVAGGCNFPEAGKPKKYYAGVYAARMDRATLQWRLVGFLPEAAAYGATIACGDSLLFLGGNNTDHALAAVYSVRLNSAGTDVSINRLADLPATADNMAVALVGNDVLLSAAIRTASRLLMFCVINSAQTRLLKVQTRLINVQIQLLKIQTRLIKSQIQLLLPIFAFQARLVCSP